MTGIKYIALALTATQGLGVLAWQLDPTKSSNERAPYPACTRGDPETDCIVGGKYLVPELDMGGEGSNGNKAFKDHLTPSTPTLGAVWTNNKMPEPCYRWGVTKDRWKVEDFRIYNVTYESDCNIAPFVICWNRLSPKSAEEIAWEIGRLPAPMRQAASAFMVYGDNVDDNPDYDHKGFIATLAADGLILGRSKAYFPAALVHEITHSIDSTLISPDAIHPEAGKTFSKTQDWTDAVNGDGYAISAHGAAQGYTEDFGDFGRAMLIDAIYPGHLTEFADKTANLTQISNQVAKFKQVAGKYYKAGGNCTASLKFPYPVLVDVGPGLPQYSQCGGKDWTGPTKCDTGLLCKYVK
ncbi:hypothetical protein B0H66DRAFT_528730 [Apodospora peruviana]|uniref:CBM1 domain-containing protein n=1 Tax=Apodospora peruviana TaxID=516989 RepID=A0AAE0MG70_9PEZI|nr:hypothetical protein B0H66DRAFT_528730 [Apodospora peruviana]